MAYDFPASPILNQTFNNYVWDGEKWKLQSPPVTGAVRYDIAQSLNSTQRSQARANIDVTRKNYIINGAMMVSQENGGTAITGTGYAADQWNTYVSGAATLYSQQVIAPSIPASPAGSPNRLNWGVSPADTSITSGDFYFVYQRIEGLRVAELMWGTALAKTVTLQFGWNSPAGTYGVAIINTDASRTYLANFTISAGQAGTDTVQSITIPGDTAGTWKKDNTVGMHVQFTFATSRIGVAGWNGAGSFDAAPGITNNVGAVGPAWQLFDVSLTEGTVAPPFMVPDYASELLACQRYWCRRYGAYRVQSPASGLVAVHVPYPVIMRAVPTNTYTDGAPINIASNSLSSNRVEGATYQFTHPGNTDSYNFDFTVKANARL